MHKYLRMTVFFPTLLYEIEDCFSVSLLYIKDNSWGRASMVYLFSCWVLRRFNLLRHINLGFTNISFCERFKYNPFNCPSVIFSIVFLTWYDLTSYYILLPFHHFYLGFFDFELYVLVVFIFASNLRWLRQHVFLWSLNSQSF